ncbi:hypothetical protein [Rufibacter soli]
MFVSFSLMFWSCETATDLINPEITALRSKQTQQVKGTSEKEAKDDKYRTDKTGQYVSKNVQVTGYDDGSQRPTRYKQDAAGGKIGTYDLPEEDTGGGGGYIPPTVTSTFVKSDGTGYTYPNQYYTNPNNYIRDLKIIKGSSSSVGTDDLPGYSKIPVDLNRGAGGQYIYLCFTRELDAVQGSDTNPGAWVNDDRIGRTAFVRNIEVVAQSIGPAGMWPNPEISPPIEVKDALGFHCPDLNDGASGKYIYAYQYRDNYNTTAPYVREVGVLYGNSSTIQPPTGWTRIEGDLNEGAGGDYIYFCVKF